MAGPALYVAIGALLALMVDAFLSRRSWFFPAFALAAGVIAGGAELLRTGSLDRFTLALSLIVLVGALFVTVASGVMNHEGSMPPGEFHFLLGASAAGALCMVGARDLVTLIVSIELLALPSIALVGLRSGDREAIRSAWTFFLVSVVSTAVTLMGVSLLYGISGSMVYAEIDSGLKASTVPGSVMAVAVALTLVGLLFKLGAVPFHMWIPDAYRGASIPVAAYLSVVSKAASIGALIILVAVALPSVSSSWMLLIAVAATLTMTVGNLGALRQRDGVGMLAWSSIAQAGFLLAAVVAVFTPEGLSAPIQYLAVYAVANLVAFTVLALVRRSQGATSYEALRGLARTDPLAGGALAFALFTLAGFPPAVIGLLTKFLV
ncbi:MAG TPA: NADH-quinone oxidoreductase subunit N, partial [Aeromicrobium sp.]|nr:NADH-quinone oxidoreductase subunit N [Aeromicrobium sp.]